MTDKSFGVIPYRKESENYYFLLIQHHAGHWSFPKGHAEGNENILQAAKREFEEETGVKKYEVLSEKIFSETYYFKRDSNVIRKTVEYFIGKVFSREVHIQVEEIRNYKWVNYQEALSLLTYKQTKYILRQVAKYMKENNL